MNYYKSILAFLLLFPFSLSSANPNNGWYSGAPVPGVYKSGRELLYIGANSSFWLKRTRQANDVVMTECNDTIAKGVWNAVRPGILRLTNSVDFEKVVYDVSQEKKLSPDSIYVEIRLPKEDAFFDGRFGYDLFFSSGDISAYHSDKSWIVLPRSKVMKNDYLNFSLAVQDKSPHCFEGHKCYQRIFFRVFNDFEHRDGTNYFTISLPNFTECFVERMDVDNEILLIDGGRISWRGNVYTKVKP